MFKNMTKDDVFDMIPNDIKIKMYSEVNTYETHVDTKEIHVQDLGDKPDLKIH